MANFCSCGSIIINDHCTNKNCNFKSSAVKSASQTKKTKEKAEKTENQLSKPKKTRKSSKCITYNLNEIKEKESVE